LTGRCSLWKTQFGVADVEVALQKGEGGYRWVCRRVVRLDSFIKTESRRNADETDELPFDLETAIQVAIVGQEESGDRA
jgi:hypothetical protein